MAENGRGSRRYRLLVGAAIVVVAAVAILPRLRLDEPPRYDGAGYATLARGLARGAGYRDVSHPDAPPHAHFPPGYPLALAAIFRLSGDSIRLAHLFSVGCTLFAVWAFWRIWLRSESRRVADGLGLALACNWAWARNGGAIQSEPLFLGLMGSSLLASGWASRGGGIGRGAVVGLLLGLGILTRHVGICVLLAVGIDLWLAGRRSTTLAMLVAASAVVSPWLAWQARVGRGTQAGLFRPGTLAGLVADQAVFYARRLPDAVFGPFVEVATVFGRSSRLASIATVGALGFAAIVLLGWSTLARDPRRRLGGLVPLTMFPLLLAWPFTEAGRFLVPLVPFILWGLVEGLATIAARTGRAGLDRGVVGALVLAGSIPYSAYSLISDREGARIATHAEFDSACRWIASRVDHPGPVLARHPADVAWLTGRLALSGEGGDLGRQIHDRGVAFLLIDEARYANAPASSLLADLGSAPGPVRLAWRGDRSIRVYEVGPFPGETR